MLPLFKPSVYDVFAKNHPTLGESHDSFMLVKCYTLAMIVPVEFLDVIYLVHDGKKDKTNSQSTVQNLHFFVFFFLNDRQRDP